MDFDDRTADRTAAYERDMKPLVDELWRLAQAAGVPFVCAAQVGEETLRVSAALPEGSCGVLSAAMLLLEGKFEVVSSGAPAKRAGD